MCLTSSYTSPNDERNIYLNITLLNTFPYDTVNSLKYCLYALYVRLKHKWKYFSTYQLFVFNLSFKSALIWRQKYLMNKIPVALLFLLPIIYKHCPNISWLYSCLRQSKFEMVKVIKEKW